MGDQAKRVGTATDGLQGGGDNREPFHRPDRFQDLDQRIVAQ